MKIKTAIVAFMLMLAALPALAQTGGVRGTVMDRDLSRPVKDAKVTLFYTDKEMFVYTGADGVFEFDGIEDGVYNMEISAAGYLKTQLSVRVSGGEVYDLMNVSITPDVPMTDFMSDDMFADFEVEDESGSGCLRCFRPQGMCLTILPHSVSARCAFSTEAMRAVCPISISTA